MRCLPSPMSTTEWPILSASTILPSCPSWHLGQVMCFKGYLDGLMSHKESIYNLFGLNTIWTAWFCWFLPHHDYPNHRGKYPLDGGILSLHRRGRYSSLPCSRAVYNKNAPTERQCNAQQQRQFAIQNFLISCALFMPLSPTLHWPLLEAEHGIYHHDAHRTDIDCNPYHLDKEYL